MGPRTEAHNEFAVLLLMPARGVINQRFSGRSMLAASRASRAARAAAGRVAFAVDGRAVGLRNPIVWKLVYVDHAGEHDVEAGVSPRNVTLLHDDFMSLVRLQAEHPRNVAVQIPVHALKVTAAIRHRDDGVYLLLCPNFRWLDQDLSTLILTAGLRLSLPIRPPTRDRRERGLEPAFAARAGPTSSGRSGIPSAGGALGSAPSMVRLVGGGGAAALLATQLPDERAHKLKHTHNTHTNTITTQDFNV